MPREARSSTASTTPSSAARVHRGRGLGWDLLAFWHSHTHTEASPSPTDRARAYWNDPVTGEEVATYPETAYYLILSLQELEAPEIRAFRFEDGEPIEEDVTVR